MIDKPETTIRVSVAALLRVRLADSRVLLLDTGGPVIGPPGGAVAYRPAAADQLAALSWRPEREPAAGQIDLRGVLPAGNLPAFLDWLAAGDGRESAEQAVRREAAEEMTEARHPDLADHVAGADLAYLGARIEPPTPATSTSYDLVMRQFEIFDLVPGGELHERLTALAADPAAPAVRAASTEDISRGRLGTARIGTQTAYLIEPATSAAAHITRA
jgi:hypothetical protein